jgi:tetratricopeptide (TPR) repeat protein
VARYSPSAARRAVLVAAIVLLGSHRARSEERNADWGSAAAELTRQGQEHARRGDDALALRRFAEAVRLDPTYGPAYLELAAARERGGDFDEATRTYDVAIEHVPDYIAAFRARAALLRKTGDFTREIADLEHLARIAEGPDTLRALATRYAEVKAWPAALATFRKLRAWAEEHGDEPLRRDAHLQVRALTVLSAELDPVMAGKVDRGWLRRALASIARRGAM